MVAKVNQKLSTREVTGENYLEFINRELVPTVEKIRLALDGIPDPSTPVVLDEEFLVSASSADLPNAVVLTAGTNITLTPGPGTLTVSAAAITVSGASVRAHVSIDTLVYSAAIPATIVFDTIDEDTQGEFDAGTYTYTATAARLLLVTAQLRVVAAARFDLTIRKNSSVVAESYSHATAGGGDTILVTDVVRVGVGDTIDVQVAVDAGIELYLLGSTKSYLTLTEIA